VRLKNGANIVFKLRCLFLAFLILIISCQSEDIFSVEFLRGKTYQGIQPSSIHFLNLDTLSEEWSPHRQVLDSFNLQKIAELVYIPDLSDTLRVQILKFKNDYDAYGFFLHSGLYEKNRQWLFGDHHLRFYYASGLLFRVRTAKSRLFHYEDTDAFLKQFSKELGHVPEIFTSFPRQDRIKDSRAMQRGDFMGKSFSVPIAVQGYQDSTGMITMARTIEPLSDTDFYNYLKNFEIVDSITGCDEVCYVLKSELDLFLFGRQNGKMLAFYNTKNFLKFQKWTEKAKTMVIFAK
jgi:hypothetical protein